MKAESDVLRSFTFTANKRWNQGLNPVISDSVVTW